MTITKTYKAPAKVNLTLRILGKRDDGYHDLESLMVAVNLYDGLTISVEDGDDILVTSNDTTIGEGEDNICYHGAKVILDKLNLKKKVTIHIDKVIPHGAGLGGGSSDGATVIKALNELLDGNLCEKEIIELCGLIGSDVPFFVLNSPAIATGRGEKLDKKVPKLPNLPMIIVKPPFSVSTKEAYGTFNSLNLTKKPQNYTIFPFKDSIISQADVAGLLVNDLEQSVFETNPLISQLKDLMGKSVV